jgi:hypothetical protein
MASRENGRALSNLARMELMAASERPQFPQVALPAIDNGGDDAHLIAGLMAVAGSPPPRSTSANPYR